MRLETPFFSRRAAWRGEICSTMPRAFSSSAISRSVHWLIGHPCAGYVGHPFRKSACCTRWNKPPCRSMCDASTINNVHSARSLWPSVYFHEEEVQFVGCMFTSIKQRICSSYHALQACFSRWTKPSTTSLVLGTLADMTRGTSELLTENALVRHQLVILRRHIKRPVCRKRDRLLLVLLARMVRTWKQALFFVQEDDASSASIVSSSCVLEAHIEGACEKAEAFARDDHFDEGDGSTTASGELSACVASCSSWLCGCVNELFRSR